jgi:hypothetical protein
MAPITVTSSPLLGWARAPTDSIRSMTARISSSVAACFITIIMPSAFPLLLNDTSEVLPRRCRPCERRSATIGR